MKRREFVRGAAMVGVAGALPAGLRRWPVRSADHLLVPMDEAQDDHLKAYGVTFRVLQRGGQGEWLLNHRGGSFLLPSDAATLRDAGLSGVRVEGVSDADVTGIKAGMAGGNADAIPLEKVPRVAVYVPPDAPPWDDAVTMALRYAGIDFTTVWDAEVMGDGLRSIDWLHLHHEDFTGQYSKFYLNYANAPWLQEMVRTQVAMARKLWFANVPAAKRAVAQRIRGFVERGGFLFAMCTATETLDLALASEHVDIAASFADGTPMDPEASSKMDWSQALALQDARLVLDPTEPEFS
ncbi:MAG: asparagine synthetase B, partial [Gemmatimonadales bacterium]